MAAAPTVSMDTIVSLGKRRGFIFPSSEIYGGFGGFWDYGPLGVELKRNIREAWWRANIQERDDMVGLDAALIMHPQVWVASGHVQGFTDPLVECKSCHLRYRADELMSEEELARLGALSEAPLRHDGDPDAQPAKAGVAVRCPSCGGELMPPRKFNLMFRTFVGPVEEDASVAYLRPETAQGIFVNFKNVQTTTRRKLPFGIGQIGKAFRNEITPGKYTFRSREFEQMEIEYFVKPGTDEQWHERWIQDRFNWYVRFGMHPDRLRLRPHASDELAHYAKGCSDVEYNFPFGWAELEGIANRGDFDLRQHSQFSGEELNFFDEETGEHYLPYVIEPSAGVDRSVLAFIIDAYEEEPDKEGTRVVLRFNKHIAPIKVAVLPLSRKQPLVARAREVWAQLRPHFMTQYDDAQGIGRRYRRQDEIGTPFCVTVDFQSLEDQAVTIRDRDNMTQVRVPIAELVPALQERFRD